MGIRGISDFKIFDAAREKVQHDTRKTPGKEMNVEMAIKRLQACSLTCRNRYAQKFCATEQEKATPELH